MELTPIQLIPEETPLILLAEGAFGQHSGKTATGVIRYGTWPIVAVIDSTTAGRSVREVTGIPCDAPVVSTLKEALAAGANKNMSAKALMIGTAPTGGDLPQPWVTILNQSLDAGLHLISGLHRFLRDIPELKKKAEARGLRLWDVRDPDAYLPPSSPGQPPPPGDIVQRSPRPPQTRVVTMVGSDCAVGKMFTALELTRGMREMPGEPAAFVATGQTGIMISGHGIPLDRWIGDFMAGVTERVIGETIDQSPEVPRWVFVEGQGSLRHPSYSGVTLSLIHGSQPDALILCHQASLKSIWGPNYGDLTLPPLSHLVEDYQRAASWTRPPGATPVQVLGISLNTSDLTPEAAQEYVAQLEKETGLPVTDPVRFGMKPLLEALLVWRGTPP